MKFKFFGSVWPRVHYIPCWPPCFSTPALKLLNPKELLERAPPIITSLCNWYFSRPLYLLFGTRENWSFSHHLANLPKQLWLFDVVFLNSQIFPQIFGSCKMDDCWEMTCVNIKVLNIDYFKSTLTNKQTNGHRFLPLGTPKGLSTLNTAINYQILNRFQLTILKEIQVKFLSLLFL